MTSPTQSGYIVADNEGIIYGVGETEDAAWAHAEHEFAQAHITLLDDDADSTEQFGSWTRRSGLVTIGATAALVSAVNDRGGNIRWQRIHGVACLPEEI